MDFVTHLLQILHQLFHCSSDKFKLLHLAYQALQFPSTFAISPPSLSIPHLGSQSPSLTQYHYLPQSITLATYPPDTLHLTAHKLPPSSHPLLLIHTLPSRTHVNVNVSRFSLITYTLLDPLSTCSLYSSYYNAVYFYCNNWWSFFRWKFYKNLYSIFYSPFN